MCFDPLTLAGLALSTGGALVNSSSQRSAARGVERASEREYERQHGFQEQAGGVRDEAVAAFANPQERLEQAGTERGALLADQVSEANTYVPVAGSTPEVVKTEIAKALSDAVSEGKQSAQRLGRLGGFNDAMFGGRLGLADAGGQLGDISSMARGSFGVLPVEQEAARRSAYSPIGDIMSGAGMFAGLAGATGMGPSWGSLFGPPGASPAGGFLNPGTGMYGRL